MKWVWKLLSRMLQRVSICYGRKVLVGHLLFMGNLLGVYLHSVGVYFGVLNNNISFKIENTKIQWGSMRSKKKKCGPMGGCLSHNQRFRWYKVHGWYLMFILFIFHWFIYFWGSVFYFLLFYLTMNDCFIRETNMGLQRFRFSQIRWYKIWHSC